MEFSKVEEEESVFSDSFAPVHTCAAPLTEVGWITNSSNDPVNVRIYTRGCLCTERVVHSFSFSVFTRDWTEKEKLPAAVAKTVLHHMHNSSYLLLTFDFFLLHLCCSRNSCTRTLHYLIWNVKQPFWKNSKLGAKCAVFIFDGADLHPQSDTWYMRAITKACEWPAYSNPERLFPLVRLSSPEEEMPVNVGRTFDRWWEIYQSSGCIPN